MRFLHLGRQSIWLDEAFSLYYARQSPVHVITRVLRSDNHPPLYYLLLHVWTDVFGTSALAGRSLSAVFSAAVIPVVYALGKLLVDSRTGLVAALLVALAPFQIAEAREMRNYSLLALLAATSYYFFFRLQLGKGGRGSAAAYVVFTAAMLYTHIFGVFVLAAQALYVVCELLVRAARRQPWVDEFRRWLLLQGLAFLLFLPWIIAIFGEHTTVRSIAGGTEILPRPSLRELPGAVHGAAGSYLSLAVLVGVAALALGSLRYPALRRLASLAPFRDPRSPLRETPALVFWFAVPVIVPFAASYVISPIYQFKYTIGATVSFYLLAALALCALRSTVVLLVLLAVIVGISAVRVNDVLGLKNEQWRQVAAYVDTHEGPRDAVVFDGPFVELPFDYYSTRRGVVELPGPWDRNDKVQNDPAAAVPEVRARRPARVWLIVSHSNSHELIRRRLATLYRVRLDRRYVGIELMLLVRR